MKMFKTLHKMTKLMMLIFTVTLLISQSACTTAKKSSYSNLVVNEVNKEKYAQKETSKTDTKFEWFEHHFTYENKPAMLLYRLYIPEIVEGEKYPLVMNLHGSGGMGSDNKKHLDTRATVWAEDSWQKKHPSYVLAVQMPFDGEVSMESELAYLYEYGEIIKKVSAQFKNIDMDRIYITGLSQGAGFSYGATVMQPDLYAAALITSGTSVHSTWGEQLDLSQIKDLNLYIVHGAKDEWILPDEAYRVYDDLVRMGKKNITLEVITTEGLKNKGYPELVDPKNNYSYVRGAAGHITTLLTLNPEGTKWMEWLFTQKKGIPYIAAPEIIEWDNAINELEYPGWNMNMNYKSIGLNGKNSGRGNTVVGKIRISGPGNISFDYPDVQLKAGDVVYYTLQGYTGDHGDDFAAFKKDWKLQCTVKNGSVVSVQISNKEVPGIVRPDTVMYGGGAGPTNEGSLGSNNVLNGGQVYLKITLADDFKGDKLTMHLKFITPKGHVYYQKIDESVSVK